MPLKPFATSLQQAKSQPETWTKEISEMSNRQTWMATRNAISLQAWASGPWRCALPDGATINPSGQDHVPANLSARQARALGLMTSGTFGPTGIGSSNSVALKRSLENRLRAMTASSGRTLYKLTWKRRTTPSGLSIPALRASAGTTSVNDFISHRSTTCWPTPLVSTGDWQKDANGNRCLKISGAAQMTGWATTSARDWKDTAGMATSGQNPDGSIRTRTDQLPRQVILTGWPTPRAADDQAGPDYQTKTRGAGGMSLPTTAAITGPARLKCTGQLLTGCTAGMESGGQLDPDHSRWLMRLPVALASCMPSETALTLRKLPQPAVPSWNETWTS